MKENNTLSREISNEVRSVLEKQCEFGGIDFTKVNFKSEKWYQEHNVTIEQEDAFRDWLENELYTNTKLRKAVMAFPYKSKKNIKSFVSMWLFQYGFFVNRNLNL